METFTDLIKHEDNLFAKRANFFLLTQTIFLATYTQIQNSSNKEFSNLILFLGIFTALI